MEAKDLGVLRGKHVCVFSYSEVSVGWKQAKECSDCSMFIGVDWGGT
jgi:hypothetical protein